MEIVDMQDLPEMHSSPSERRETLHCRQGELILRMIRARNGAVLGTLRQLRTDLAGNEVEIHLPVVVPAKQVSEELAAFVAEHLGDVYLVAASIGRPEGAGQPRRRAGSNVVFAFGEEEFENRPRLVRGYLNSFIPLGRRIRCSSFRREADVHASIESP